MLQRYDFIRYLCNPFYPSYLMRLLRHILFLVNLVFAVLLLLSTMAGVVAPSRFAGLSLLSYAFLPLLIINVLFAIFWLCFMRWQCLLSIVVIAVRLNYVLLSFQIGGTSEAKVEEGVNVLKVMSFNTHAFLGRDGDMKYAEGAAQFIDIVRQQQPDIICLQEYNVGKRYKTSDTLIAMGYKYYSKKQMYGDICFSRYPITKSKNLGSNSRIFADVNVDGKKIRIVGLHLGSYHLNSDDLVTMGEVVKGKADNEALTIAGKLKRAVIKHESEWNDFILPMVSSYEGSMIMVGDFNDIPTSYLHSQVRKYMVDTYTEHGSGLGTTYHGDFPVYRIDYIFHTRDLQSLSYQRIKTDISDHYPIFAEFRL